MTAELTTDITRAAEIIAQGRVVAFPTGTSYGLAVDAFQGHALTRLRNLKRRPQDKTFSVFMKEELFQKYLDLTEQEKSYININKNKAVTLLVKPKHIDQVTGPSLEHLAQDGRTALRIIDHPLMQQLANAVDVPLTATSANKSGQPACFSPSCLRQVFTGLPTPEDLPEIIADDSAGPTTYDLSLGAILDGGNLPQNKASQIIKLNSSTPEIIRA